MKISITKTTTFNLNLTGSFFIFKYLFNKPHRILKLPFLKCIDTWLDERTKKTLYTTKLRFNF